MDELDPLFGVRADDYPRRWIISTYALIDRISDLFRVASPCYVGSVLGSESFERFPVGRAFRDSEGHEPFDHLRPEQAGGNHGHRRHGPASTTPARPTGSTRSPPGAPLLPARSLRCPVSRPSRPLELLYLTG